MRFRLLIILSLFINFVIAQNYHDTQGKLQINNGGQASFNIPIAMPPSIKSVGPTINLSYTSSGISGLAGQGWGINSISSISRVASRLDIEGYRDGVDFDQNDKLALDGQYLILKSGTYWQSGSIYETEVQSNAKIELIGSGSSMYFIVTAPDGSRCWYGNYNGQQATDLTTYYITRFEDTDGNFITYHYNSTFNSIAISEIRFSANIISNPNPLNKIVFTYNTALRQESVYLKEIEVKTTKILEKVEVFTNDILFKRYQISHSQDSNGYQRVTQVQEFNSNNEPSNPILFEYNQTNYSAIENYGYYGGDFSSDFKQVVSGDFDGDGRLDFTNKDKIYLNLFSSNVTILDNVINLPISLFKGKTFAITTLENNKLKQGNQILKVEENLNSISLKAYGLNGSNLELINTKNIEINNQITECFDNCYPEMEDDNGNVIPNPNSRCNNLTQIKKSHTKYLEGDFNGDSISDFLIINFNERLLFNLIDPGSSGDFYSDYELDIPINESNPLCKPLTEIINVNEVRFIDLNTNNPALANTVGNYTIQSPHLDFLITSKFYVADFNADGRSDLIAIKTDGTYKVFSFKVDSILQNIELEVIGAGRVSDYTVRKQILFGDYNGDGKTDIMLPNSDDKGCKDCDLWHIYLSNPKLNNGELFEKISKNIVEYWTNSETYYETQFYFNQYYAIDVNKDGKTDLVRIWMSKYQPQPFWDDKDWDTKWRYEAYINNLGFNGQFNQQFVSTDHHNQDPGLPLPIVANMDYVGNGRHDKFNSDIVVLRWYGQLQYLDIEKDYTQDNLLKIVKQSNNAIVDEIFYNKLTLPIGGLGNSSNFYSSSNQYNYPLVEFKQMTSYNAVSKLINTSGGLAKQQLFKYNGLTFDVIGIGLVGFKKVARTNWFLNESDDKIWVESVIDPTKRGALISASTFKPSNTTSFLFLNSTPPATSLINQQVFNFQQLNAVGTYPYVLLKTYEKNTDFISGTIKDVIYEYSTDGYYLENKTLTRSFSATYLTNIQGTNLIETLYDNNTSGVGANYYIGRPKEYISTNKLFVNTISNNSSDNSNTQVSSEKLFYNNNNLIKTEKTFNGSTEKLVEEFEYFSNGLMSKKTMSAQGTTSANAVVPIVTEFTYDTTNRFIKTTKNVNDNLTVTNNNFDPIYGLVTSSTNALGQTTTYVYDKWGKNTQITDFLGKSIVYTYSKNGNIFTTLETGDDGTASAVEQDELAREIRKGSKDLNGNWNYIKTEYDGLGRKYRVSEPYAGTSSPSQWSTIEYDLLSRPIKSTAHTGKIVNTIYDSNTIGSIVTANEPLMSKTKYLDANGLVYKAIDEPGGIINYKYDANGNLLESNYEGILTKIEYDSWGRKSRLEDTSAGIYTYSYDAFGKIKTETTPKGSTSYTYDNGGRIATKTLVGLTTSDATNMTATYTYDATNKWLTNLSITNPIDGNSSYDYTYDSATKQINQSVENLYEVGSSSPVATFTRSFTFDNFGRVDSETTTALSYGKTSTKSINYTYKNGVKWQLKDGATIIWQANDVNSRGQLTTAQLGNGINISNTYDSYGYLSQQKHDKGTINFMTLNNQFDPILGNLMNRYNSLFDSKEYFEYDSLDRLVKWNGVSTMLLNLPFNTTTDGFTFVGGSTKGSVSNVSGTMKVILKAPSETELPIAAQRNLAYTFESGEQVRIRAAISNKSGSYGVITQVTILETDPSDPNNYAEYEVGSFENGNLDFTYTVSNLVPNPVLKLRFSINPASPESSSGGGTVSANATFYVDNLRIDKIPSLNQVYDNKGRITQNVLGEYKYEIQNKPYQNSKVKLSSQGQSYYASSTVGNQEIDYNMFSSPYRIAIPNKDILDISYNISEQRSIMYWGNTNSNKIQRPYRRYYSADGSMEVTANFTNNNFTTPSSVEIITFVGGNAYSSDIVVKNTYLGSATTPTGGLFYLHRDYQVTILAISNATGVLVEKRQFDPWGLLSKVQDSSGNTLAKLTFFDRGYTGHEHLESVGLINMNGRIYDPMLHRFLQPDSKVQEPYNTQNYNRYGYCLNNPLKYSDISGEDFGVSFAIAMGVALAVYFGDAIINDRPITFRGIATTVVTTSVSAGIAYGIGGAVAGINNLYVRATVQAIAHGTTQGTLTAIQGGKFWTGFATGSLSSVMSSLWEGGYHYKDNGNYTMSKVRINGIGGANPGTVGTMFFGTISGGAGAAISGGNFWQGAVTGMIVSGMNHVAHAMQQKGHLKEWLSKAGVNYKDVPKMTSAQVLELINRVPELGQFYSESGSFDIAVNENVDYDLTSGSTKTRFGTMTFGTDAFKSMLNLGRSIIHETGHALDLFTGNYAKFNVISDKDFRTDVMEYRMYERELQYVLPEYNRSGLNYRNEFYMRISNRGYDPDSFLKW